MNFVISSVYSEFFDSVRERPQRNDQKSDTLCDCARGRHPANEREL